MTTAEIIDVTLIEPRLKHASIFEKFDALADGEAVIIHNDHDPRPLYYQLLAERGNVFTWEYLENGPETWEVRIQKIAEKDKATIGELVAKDYRKAEVFKKFGLDFCCGGKKTVDDACAEKGIDVVELNKELKELDNMCSVNTAPVPAETGLLIDYIIDRHHGYIRSALPAMLEYIRKVASVHGNSHPETIEVSNLTSVMKVELESHLKKEEEILFPYIRRLSVMKDNKQTVATSPFGSVDNAILRMEDEHDEIGDIMKQMRELTNGYALPPDACATYRLCYDKFREFENDLFRHIHLENNVLFPLAEQLEKELLGKQ